MQDFLKQMAENCAICKELSSSYIKPVQLQALERAWGFEIPPNDFDWATECAYCGSIFPDPYGKSIGWRSITDFDPDNYQNGWIVFYSVGRTPIMVDCKNERDLMESVDVFGLFEEFLFVANGIAPAYRNYDEQL